MDPGAGQIGRRTEIAAIASPDQICNSTVHSWDLLMFDFGDTLQLKRGYCFLLLILFLQ